MSKQIQTIKSPTHHKNGHKLHPVGIPERENVHANQCKPTSTATDLGQYTNGLDVILSRANPLGHVQALHEAQQLHGNAYVQRLISRQLDQATDTGLTQTSSGPAGTPSNLPLQRGSRGPAVVQIQQSLLQAGYPLGEFGADGIFGRLTRRAVGSFQRAHRLPETKIVDLQTWNSLVQVPPGQASATTATTVAPPKKKVTPAAAATVGEAELAQKIVADVRAGGITIAVYAFRDVKSVAEFERQATQYAVDHQALGLSQGAVRIGAAMEMAGDLSGVIQTFMQSVAALLQRHPDLTGGQTMNIPIRTLSIFTHGITTGIQAGRDGKWIKNQLVPQIAPFLSATPRILFFACSTASAPKNGIPYAEAVRQALQAALEQRYGPQAGVAPEVWGHTTAGHTTANKMLVGFGGGSASTAGDSLIGITGQRLAEMAIQKAGRTTTLSNAQRKEVENKARRSMERVLQARTGKKDPTMVFIREVPQMGIERVWRAVSGQASDDFSDLGLTPEATERVLQGLKEFQSRFPSHLAELQQVVSKFPTP